MTGAFELYLEGVYGSGNLDGRGHMGGYERTIFVLITAHECDYNLTLGGYFGIADHGNTWTGALTPI